MYSPTAGFPLSLGEVAFTTFRILPLVTSTAFLSAVYHQSVVFSTICSTTPVAQRSAPLTFKTIRTFGHALIFFTSFFVISDLAISLLNVFWHPSAIPGTPKHSQAGPVAKYLYLLSFVMKVLHFFPHAPATRVRNAMRDDDIGETAAENLFDAMDVWVKLAAGRWFTLDLPAWAVTLTAVVLSMRNEGLPH